jgi:pheromone shutdown protein TraB
VLVALLWSSWQKPNKEEIRKWLDSVMKEETDILTESFQELRRHFPTLYATIVAERDAYLAAKLIQTCRGLSLLAQKHQTGRKTVVAVVGAGHVPGICDFMTNSTHLKSPEEVLSDLVVTRKWADDPLVQKEAIPMWVTQVTEVSDQKNTNN